VPFTSFKHNFKTLCVALQTRFDINTYDDLGRCNRPRDSAKHGLR